MPHTRKIDDRYSVTIRSDRRRTGGWESEGDVFRHRDLQRYRGDRERRRANHVRRRGPRIRRSTAMVPNPEEGSKQVGLIVRRTMELRHDLDAEGEGKAFPCGRALGPRPTPSAGLRPATPRPHGSETYSAQRLAAWMSCRVNVR